MYIEDKGKGTEWVNRRTVPYKNGKRHGIEIFQKDFLKSEEAIPWANGIQEGEGYIKNSAYGYTTVWKAGALVEKIQIEQEFPSWKSTSDGLTWQSASYSAKQELCSDLARRSRKGNSSQFFYDALEAFYRGGNVEILRTKIDDISPLIEAGSSALPKNMRNY